MFHPWAWGDEVPDKLFRFNPETQEYKEVDQNHDAEESNYKMYNRKHLLYCQAEKAAANHCFQMPAEKPMWSNKTGALLRGLVLRYALDPPVHRRMPLEKFAYHEKELRQLVLTGLRDSRWATWDEGLAHLEIKQFIMMHFKLEDLPAKAPPQTPSPKGRQKQGNDVYSPIKNLNQLPQVHPYGGGKGNKGGQKGGKGGQKGQTEMGSRTSLPRTAITSSGTQLRARGTASSGTAIDPASVMAR